MATRFVLYVDNTTPGVDTNSGSSAGATPRISGVAATWGAGATIIQLDTPIDLSVVTANLDTIKLEGADNTRTIYHIVSVDNVNDQVTVAETLTNASGAARAWAIGGAMLTPAQAFAQANAISGTLYDHIYIKGGTAYQLGAVATTPRWSFALAGGRDVRTFVDGFTAAIGDNGFCVLDGSDATGANATVLSVTSTHAVLRNIKLTGQKGSGNALNVATNNGNLFWNVWATDPVADSTGHLVALGTGIYATFVGCRCSGAVAGTSGFCTGTIDLYLGCIAHDNSAGNTGGHGWLHSNSDSPEVVLCIADTNGGDGINSNRRMPRTISCTSYGNGRDGIRLLDAASSHSMQIYNNILDTNIGTGILRVGTTLGFPPCETYNNFNGNAAERSNVSDLTVNDVTPKDFTGSLLTAPATQDFTINAGGKAKGFPGAFQVGGTGYLDVGAVQRQEAGGMIMSRVRTGF
jgi:hypothetical protein